MKEEAAKAHNCKGSKHKDISDEGPLPNVEATTYRACVARIANLALDRWDMMSCARVLSRKAHVPPRQIGVWSFEQFVAFEGCQVFVLGLCFNLRLVH